MAPSSQPPDEHGPIERATTDSSPREAPLHPEPPKAARSADPSAAEPSALAGAPVEGSAPDAPAAAALAEPFETLAPGFVGAERLGNAIGVVVLAAIGLGAFTIGFFKGDLSGRTWTWMLAGAATLLLLLVLQSWFWPLLTFARTRYRLGARALEIRRGVLTRRWISVPRSRIQHTDVSSGPIQRRFGIATLTVNTAGTTNASIGLTGVSGERARALRDELMAGLEERSDDGV